MSNDGIKPSEALPKTNFFDKAIDVVSSFDRHMITIYSALIAGIVLLLLNEEVSLWVGAALVIALALFVVGIGHTLLHISFMSKLLLLAEALSNGTSLVPNAVEAEIATIDAYKRTQAYAQTAFAYQCFCLFIGVGFGAFAVVIRLWEYTCGAGVLALALVALLIFVGVVFVIWRRVIRQFPPGTSNHPGK